MPVNGNKQFAQEARRFVLNHPEFVYDEDSNSIEGVADIWNECHDRKKSFYIRIEESQRFPYRFPRLYEIGGDIPENEDWHKYKESGQCCVALPREEQALCARGISLEEYYELYAKPYFANQWYKIEFGRYVNEYPHSKAAALWLYYGQIFNTKELNVIKTIGFSILNGKIGRNSNCPCGSGMKYKVCHMNQFDVIKTIGRENFVKDMDDIEKCLSKEASRND